MAAKFQITFKDGRETIKDLSINDAVDYKVKNLTDASNFDIEEMASSDKPKTTRKPKDFDYDKELKKYEEELSDYQKYLIRHRYRDIIWNKSAGFMLRVLKQVPEGIYKSTIEKIEKERFDVLHQIRNVLFSNKGYIKESSGAGAENFEKVFSEIVAKVK